MRSASVIADDSTRNEDTRRPLGYHHDDHKTWKILDDRVQLPAACVHRLQGDLYLQNAKRFHGILLEALQLQRSFGLLEFLPFDPVSDAVLSVCYFHPCYIALYIILPSIFRSS
jgi:hypothetical protein